MAHAMPSWFGFLALEADLAMTFIDCARLRTNPGEFANSVENARKALAEIQRSLVKPTARGLTMNEVSYLEGRSGEIESALVALTRKSS
jgi:ABC-type cobalt transport system substrate-binding protein